MTEQIFFTSDTHFGHKSILHLGNGRPFSSVEEMDEAMIERWNDRVGPNDRIYHLGDFSFYNPTRTESIVRRLNGHKHFVSGNHDKPMNGLGHYFESVQDYKSIKVGSQKLVLFHFPILSWLDVGRGSWMLHGHCHGNLKEDLEMARMDIGVDTHDFRPWSFEEISARLLSRTGTPSDHHQRKV